MQRQPRKYRWSRHYESAEEELVGLLEAKRLPAKRCTIAAGEELGPQTTSHGKQVWCAEGSIVYTVAGQRLSLQAGDTLEIPAGLPYDALAGISGAVYYEL